MKANRAMAFVTVAAVLVATPMIMHADPELVETGRYPVRFVGERSIGKAKIPCIDDARMPAPFFEFLDDLIQFEHQLILVVEHADQPGLDSRGTLHVEDRFLFEQDLTLD